MEIFYDLETSTRPLGVAYISGSATPQSFLNPSYRIYTIDGTYQKASYQVLNHENYFLNLTEANLSMKPEWKKEYSAKVLLIYLNNIKNTGLFLIKFILFRRISGWHLFIQLTGMI
jgi:hypothetical protein